MRRMACTAIAGISFAVFWGAAVSAQQVATPSDSKRPVRPTDDEVNALVSNLQLRKQQEGWRFDVGKTSALALAPSELTGAESGLPSQGFLKSRQEFAERAIRLYKAAKRKAGVSTGMGAHCSSKASSFSWLANGKVTQPREQRTPDTPPSCAACWAFASIGALESGYLIENGESAGGDPGPVSASEQVLVNCTPNSNCDLGYVVNALDFLVRRGTTGRGESMYQGMQLPCSLNFDARYRVVAWKPLSLDSHKVNPPARIKKALCNDGPVTARLIYTPSFGSYLGNGAYHQEDAVSITDTNAHHVLIVGWDDSKGAKGAWLIKNSWVENWGLVSENMPGYAWVEYGANLIGHHANAVQAFHRNVPVSLLGPKYQSLIEKYLSNHAGGGNGTH